MRILVTGAAGFVGPHLARELSASGHEVWGTGRSTDSPPAGLEQWCPTELTERDAVSRLLRNTKPECILHLAAQSNPAASWSDPEETFRVNTSATSLLVDEAGRSGKVRRFVFISSSDVYGAPDPGHLPVREPTPRRPANPYAVSKAAAEDLVSLYSRRHDIEHVILRPFSHTGPGQTDRFVVPAFARQIAMIEAGQQHELRHGSLEAWRDFSDVRDIVKAYRLAAERATTGSIYNVCSGTGITIQSILDRLVSCSGVDMRTMPDKDRLRPEKVVKFRGDNSAIKRDLGWKPRISMDETLQDVLAYQRTLLRSSPENSRATH